MSLKEMRALSSRNWFFYPCRVHESHFRFNPYDGLYNFAISDYCHSMNWALDREKCSIIHLPQLEKRLYWLGEISRWEVFRCQARIGKVKVTSLVLLGSYLAIKPLEWIASHTSGWVHPPPSINVDYKMMLLLHSTAFSKRRKKWGLNKK